MSHYFGEQNKTFQNLNVKDLSENEKNWKTIKQYLNNKRLKENVIK